MILRLFGALLQLTEFGLIVFKFLVHVLGFGGVLDLVLVSWLHWS